MIKRISVSIFILTSIFFISCEKQEEETRNRDAIVGKWDVVEHVASSKSVDARSIDLAYIVYITRSETFADEVNLYNFFNIGEDYKIPAAVDGLNITISKIEIRDYTSRGSGKISSDHKTIDWTYWVEDPYGDEKKYEATYTFIK